MTVPVIDTGDGPWEYRADRSGEECRRYFHLESIFQRKAVVREEEDSYTVILVHMQVCAEKEDGIEGVEEANLLAEMLMEEYN